MKKVLSLVVIILIFYNCSKKEENEIVCLPAPSNKNINIVDKITGENVFTNGRFLINQLVIETSPINLFTVAFDLGTQGNKFTIFPIKKVGTINFSIILNNEITIPLTAKIIETSGCGVNYYFESINSENLNYTIEEINRNEIKIKI